MTMKHIPGVINPADDQPNLSRMCSAFWACPTHDGTSTPSQRRRSNQDESCLIACHRTFDQFEPKTPSNISGNVSETLRKLPFLFCSDFLQRKRPFPSKPESHVHFCARDCEAAPTLSEKTNHEKHRFASMCHNFISSNVEKHCK